MSVETLRQAIKERSRELLVPALLASGLTAHKRHWRDCPCSWCAKKREATASIANMTGVPAYRLRRGLYVEDLRDVVRDELRVKFRKEMKDLEGD